MVARLIYGFRISVAFGLILTILSSLIGMAAGAVQGYFGGWTDLLFQRFIEIWTSMPTLYLLIILAAFITPTFWILLFILVLFSWTALVGLVRAEFLRARNFEYVRAARALGLSDAKIMFKHLLPNAMVSTITFMPFILSGSVTTLTALDFLGFGLPPGSPSLGELIAQGKNNLQAPWLGITGFLVVSVMLSLAGLHRRGGARCARSEKDLCMSDRLLEVKDLSVAFRQGGASVLAVDKVSFAINKGETLALVGESGSGKSVSALSILKLLPYPSASHPSGSVLFKGEELLDADERDLRRVRGNDITMIFQEPMTSLNPLHTVERQIGEILEIASGRDRRCRAQPHRGAAHQGGHPGRGDATAGLSAPAVRRAAPARDDRHGAGQQSRPADCRRADHGAGRDRAGADPQAAEGSAARDRHGAAADHP